MTFQQSFYTEQPLLQALGVVEAVDADTDQRIRTKSELGNDAGATLGDRRCDSRPAVRPFDGDRIRPHQRLPARLDDGLVFAVDARLQEAIGRIEKIVAMQLGVESHDAATEHSLDQFAPPRADAELFGIWPGDMPERRMVARGRRLRSRRGARAK